MIASTIKRPGSTHPSLPMQLLIPQPPVRTLFFLKKKRSHLLSKPWFRAPPPPPYQLSFPSRFSLLHLQAFCKACPGLGKPPRGGGRNGEKKSALRFSCCQVQQCQAWASLLSDSLRGGGRNGGKKKHVGGKVPPSTDFFSPSLPLPLGCLPRAGKALETGCRCSSDRQLGKESRTGRSPGHLIADAVL